MQLLEKTIAACTNLEYPNNKFKIHVCDDGRRESLKILCSNYKVNYISREDNEGAKAGNINNALKFLTGDLFAVLDADMIPKKSFLLKLWDIFQMKIWLLFKHLRFIITRICINIIFLKIYQMNKTFYERYSGS